MSYADRYSTRAFLGQDYDCGGELWVREEPAACRRPMIRLGGLGQTAEPSPAEQIRTGLLTVIAVSAAVGALQGAAIGAIAGGPNRTRARSAAYGAAAGAALNALGLTLLVLPTLRVVSS